MGKYFTIDELCRSAVASRRGIDNTPGAEAVANMEELIARLLDPLRERWGKPLAVNSGYRSPELNAAVGGVATSQHLFGQAADITTGSRAGNRKLFEVIAAGGFEFDQLIDEAGYAWIHISWRGGRNRCQVLHLS